MLPFQEVEKGCVPKFGVLIFNLALVIKKWPHQAGSTVKSVEPKLSKGKIVATIRSGLSSIPLKKPTMKLHSKISRAALELTHLRNKDDCRRRLRLLNQRSIFT